MSNKTKKKQVQNQAQDGRSMVEMLGVLAVIGVISIGGIAGYRMAMNRYQANQIANEINLMRTDAKMKVARGVELLLGEPYDGEDGHLNFNANYGVEVKFEEIGTDTPGETEKGYSFTLSNIPEGVCKPLVALLDNMDDTADITIGSKSYYDENASEDFCGETNEVMVAFSTKDLGVSSSGSGNPEVTDPADEPQECNPETCPGTCNAEGVCECPEGSHLKGDECVTCSGGKVWDGNDCSCPAGAEKSGEDGEECACSTEKPHWNGTECTACPEGSNWNSETGECECEDGKVWKESVSGEDKCVEIVGECESNADCGPGEYCYLQYGKSCTQEFQSGKFGLGNSDSYKGKCKKAKSDINTSGDTNSKYIISTSNMTWWSAERFCKALGRKMVTISELQCKHKIQYSGGDCTSGYCHAKDSSIQSCTGGSNTNLSEVVKELRRAKSGGDGSSGSGYLWLYDAYANTTSSRNSCEAYRIDLPDGYVIGSSRYLDRCAICE